jgi:signal transduction histidine kinase
MNGWQRRFLIFIYNIQSIGLSNGVDDYGKRKLGIFNLINFFQLLTGISVAIAGLSGNTRLAPGAWLVACLPAFTSLLVLTFNHLRKYETAQLAYFFLQPFFTCIVYLNGLNLGLELFFIFYGVFSVFFLRDLGYMIFSIAFSMVSYFVLTIFGTNYQYQLAHSNWAVYLINQVLAIIFIFYGLYLIKKENTSYHWRIVEKNEVLQQKNLEIEEQKEKLIELNGLKNKLFSVIAHDLKTPLYAMRTMFYNVRDERVPAQQVSEMVPLILNDLNYTISLMENLLQWSKVQMTTNQVQTEAINIPGLMTEVVKLLRLQAEAKQIDVIIKPEKPVYIMADKDMISLVLRNVLSNAIKFTPPKGHITLGINEHSSFVEVYIQDSGIGITPEALQKIKGNNYYTTNGTESESGTGLGLMLCKDFLLKHGGQMHIESNPGEGSIFSFTLPIKESL